MYLLYNIYFNKQNKSLFLLLYIQSIYLMYSKNLITYEEIIRKLEVSLITAERQKNANKFISHTLRDDMIFVGLDLYKKSIQIVAVD